MPPPSYFIAPIYCQVRFDELPLRRVDITIDSDATIYAAIAFTRDADAARAVARHLLRCSARAYAATLADDAAADATPLQLMIADTDIDYVDAVSLLFFMAPDAAALFYYCFAAALL